MTNFALKNYHRLYIIFKIARYHFAGVRIKRGYGCGTERIDGTDMRIKRGADMRIKRGADMRIKRGADMRIKRGADMRIKRGADMRIKHGWVVFCAN